MRCTILTLALPVLLAGGGSLAAAPPSQPSLISFSAGALIVQKPQEYDDSWSAFWLLDERPESGWATPKGVVTPQVIVIALPERTVLKRMEFDTASTDGDGGRGAKDIAVEISDSSAKDGFKKIADVTLKDRADRQSFPVVAEVPGRYLRLTVKNNHGSAEYTELMDVRGYGTQLTHTPFTDISGTYETNFNNFHVRQQGTSVTGCYEHKEGILTGGIEGRIMKITWIEGENRGPAVMVFSPDGKEIFGLWWHEGGEGAPAGTWNGTKKANTVGTCPHWAGGAREQMAQDLSQSGRTRIYGINFDTDSDKIKDESKPTLDQIVGLLKGQPDWKLTIEGHTDSTATAAHNQELSLRRANAVKAYLVGAGVEGARLKTAGFGATKPVAPNESETGRAQNRRVELTKG
ncbi:MAG: OmpA-OmpF porin, family [Acidobacteriota bacterium]|nr:OmpA-OmpF porin, family [Acidobacteriota bacterium]